MQNHVSDARTIDLVPSANILSGGVRVLGPTIVIATTDGTAAGAPISYYMEGEFLLPKATGIGTVSPGDLLLWDISAAKLSNTGAATGDILNCCMVTRAALTGATAVRVKLLPGRGTVSA